MYKLLQYMNHLRKFAAILYIVVAFGFIAGAQTNSLSWNNTNGMVNADIHGEALLPVLQTLAAQTGWHIFLEPGTTRKVSTRFSELPAGHALKMLLGDLNFALVPKFDGPSQLYIFRTEMKNATRLVVAKKPARRVPNELLVKVKSGTDINALAKILGAKVTGKLDKYGVYQLQFADAAATDAALADLQNNSDVQAVDYNYYFDPPPTAEPVSSGGATPLSLQLNPPASSGKVIVGLVDTSVNASSLGSDASQFILPQINAVDSTASSDSGPTHGTAMAAQLLQTIQSIQNASGNNSTSVQIQPVNVYSSSDEQTTSWDVAEGLTAAINAGATIVNMSLGSSGDSSVLDAVIAEGAKDGITMFAASGNTPMDAPYYPAADPGVTPVTALGQPGQLASYANIWPDSSMIALPGTGAFNYDGQSWVVQGTSTSTAIASGIYSAYAANGWNASQIEAAMAKKFPVPAQ